MSDNDTRSNITIPIDSLAALPLVDDDEEEGALSDRKAAQDALHYSTLYLYRMIILFQAELQCMLHQSRMTWIWQHGSNVFWTEN